MVSDWELQAMAFEQAAGVMRPAQARERVRALAGGELVALEEGWWTTRAHRDLEQHTLEQATGRRDEPAGPVRAGSVEAAAEAAAVRVVSELSTEQRQALEVVTAPGGVTVVVGQAGTGKGRSPGRSPGGVGARRPSGDGRGGGRRHRQTRRGRRGRWGDNARRRAHPSPPGGTPGVDADAVFIVDEAGMAETARLGAPIDASAESGAKLVLAGDDHVDQHPPQLRLRRPVGMRVVLGLKSEVASALTRLVSTGSEEVNEPGPTLQIEPQRWSDALRVASVASHI